MEKRDPQHGAVRILAKKDDLGSATGMGFLVDSKHVVTCAHVVAAALGKDSLMQVPADAVVYAFFPFDQKSCFGAKVVDGYFYPREGADTLRADVAVLELEQERPASARSIPLVTSEDLKDKSFTAFGHPTRFLGRGILAKGEMRGLIEDDRLECEQSTSQGVTVQQGFSGTAAWCEELEGAVGMVSEFAPGHGAKEGEGISIVIPTQVLIKAWPPLQNIVEAWELSRTADKMREYEDYKDAIACCEKGLELDKKNVELLLTKAACLRSSKSYEEALRCVDAVLDIENLEEAQAERGYLLHEIGRRDGSNEKIEEAIGVYNRILDNNGENWGVRASKAWGLLDLKKNNEALELVDQSLQKKGRDNADAWTTKADALLSFWEIDREEALLWQAQTCVDAALSLKGGHDCRALTVKGDVLRAFGRNEDARNDEAKDAYEAVIASKPIKPDKDTLRRAVTGEAEILKDRNDWKGAAACYDKYLSKEKDALMLVSKGLCLYSGGLYYDAVKCHSDALKLKDEAPIWYNKGLSLAKLAESGAPAKYAEAIKCCDEAMAPTRKASEQLIAYATFTKAQCLWNSAKYSDAITYYDKFLELPSKFDDKTKLDREALNEKGCCLDKLSHHQEAKESFSKCLEIFPSPQVYTNKARCLYALGKDDNDNHVYYDEAMDCLTSALKINPSYAEALYWKGLIKRFQNEYDEAIKCFEAILAKDQSKHDANFNYYAAEAWFSKGETLVTLAQQLSAVGHDNGAKGYYTQALECLEKAMECKPECRKALLLEAKCYERLGEQIKQMEVLRKALDIDPNDARTLNELREEAIKQEEKTSQETPVAPPSRPPFVSPFREHIVRLLGTDRTF